MNILIVANHFAVCSARYATDAFTRLGHSVKHIGPAMGRNIWGLQVPPEYEWVPDYSLDAVLGYERLDWPELVIVMDSDPAILDWANEHTRSAIIWGVDNHVRSYRRPNFSHYFLAHKSVSEMEWDWNWNRYWGDYDYPDKQCPDMTWLPCGYDPVAFPPSPIPWSEREYDVCCLGYMYPARWALVNAMKAAGLNVIAGCGMVYDQYRDLHHNSCVALVSSFNGDLPIRAFEGCGLGCAVLADRIADLDLLRDERKLSPIRVYEGVEEAVEAAKMLQSRPDKAEEAIEWVSSHTWDRRAEKIVEWYNTRTA